MTMHFEARFSAVGGQGIILAGTILADAAFLEGMQAAGSPTYTAQVRGGPTKVDVIIDSERILFPRTSQIDFFLSLATNSYNRFGTDIRQGAPVVVDPNLVTIPDEHREIYQMYEIPIINLTQEELGRLVYTSAVALGTFIALTDILSEESIREALKRRAPKGTESYNMKALEVGQKAAKEIREKMGV
jgi:2-oxoglutarate ferredoxin oxidoreductase subunit gamma